MIGFINVRQKEHISVEFMVSTHCSADKKKYKDYLSSLGINNSKSEFPGTMQIVHYFDRPMFRSIVKTD